VTTPFDDLTAATAPLAAQPLLARTRDVFGFVPNLAVAMAPVPAALEGYLHILRAFADTPLDPIEQQVVLMAVSRANGADYSLAVHAALAEKAGAAPDLVKAVATGGAIADGRLAALRRFAEALTVNRGHVPPYEVENFCAAGYDRAAIVAVAFGLGLKTFANSLAHLAATPVDAAFASTFADLLR